MNFSAAANFPAPLDPQFQPAVLFNRNDVAAAKISLPEKQVCRWRGSKRAEPHAVFCAENFFRAIKRRSNARNPNGG
jgi:hypothetical protein